VEAATNCANAHSVNIIPTCGLRSAHETSTYHQANLRAVL
jgi:hypothetical protein